MCKNNLRKYFCYLCQIHFELKYGKVWGKEKNAHLTTRCLLLTNNKRKFEGHGYFFKFFIINFLAILSNEHQLYSIQNKPFFGCLVPETKVLCRFLRRSRSNVIKFETRLGRTLRSNFWRQRHDKY